MLSYLRQLYDLYLDESLITTKATAATAVKEMAKASMPNAEAMPPPPTTTTTAPLAPIAKKEELPAPPPAAVTPPPPPPPVIEPVAAPVVPSASREVRAVNAKVAQLFAQPATKELSERLAQQPLKDLTRALTINNRVQYANTLFGGNSELMNSVLLRLNQLDSMARARPDLEELALEFGWIEEEKKPVAQDFIKLVNRRYV